jgi:type IV pilus assembly protein PilV
MLITHDNRAQRRQRGFSLIEVLIALVIMSVGMLGIAGLFVQGMQAGRTSVLRHHAVTLAGDIADRIRANPRAGVAYEGAAADGGCVGLGNDCDEATMAAHDVFLWEQQALDSLPTGAVAVDFDNSANPPLYTVDVSWTEPGENLVYTIAFPVIGN